MGVPGSPAPSQRATIPPMAEFLLVLIAAVVVGAIGFGVSLLITGDDPGIAQRTQRIIRMQDGQVISDEPVGDGRAASASAAAQAQTEAV